VLFNLFQIIAHVENEGVGGGLHGWRELAQDFGDLRSHSAISRAKEIVCNLVWFQRHDLGSCGLHFLDLIENIIPSSRSHTPTDSMVV